MNKFLQVMGVVFGGFLILIMWFMTTDSMRDNKIGRCALSISKNDKDMVRQDCAGLDVDQTKASITLAKEIEPELRGMDLYEYIAKETNPPPVSAPQAVIAEQPLSVPVVEPAPVPEKQADLTMTPNELVKAEHANKARFIRDIVGKTVKITGKVRHVSDGFFDFEAAQSLAGSWTVYTSDNAFLADLDAGKTVTVICKVEDAPIMGGHSRCAD